MVCGGQEVAKHVLIFHFYLLNFSALCKGSLTGRRKICSHSTHKDTFFHQSFTSLIQEECIDSFSKFNIVQLFLLKHTHTHEHVPGYAEIMLVSQGREFQNGFYNTGQVTHNDLETFFLLCFMLCFSPIFPRLPFKRHLFQIIFLFCKVRDSPKCSFSMKTVNRVHVKFIFLAIFMILPISQNYNNKLLFQLLSYISFATPATVASQAALSWDFPGKKLEWVAISFSRASS